MMRLLAFLAFLLGFSTEGITAAGPVSQGITSEVALRDKRKIAILSYGSLIKVLERDGNRLDITDAFQKSSLLKLPIFLGRKSQSNKMSVVVDSHFGESRAIYYATSKYAGLKNARTNLSWREGSSGKTDNIPYMKKLSIGTQDSNEVKIPGTDWSIKKSSNARAQLSNEQALHVAQWADAKGYTAVVWASYPPNVEAASKAAAEAKVEGMLRSDPTLAANTITYIKELPEDLRGTFENKILHDFGH